MRSVRAYSLVATAPAAADRSYATGVLLWLLQETICSCCLLVSWLICLLRAAFLSLHSCSVAAGEEIVAFHDDNFFVFGLTEATWVVILSQVVIQRKSSSWSILLPFCPALLSSDNISRKEPGRERFVSTSEWTTARATITTKLRFSSLLHKQTRNWMDFQSLKQRPTTICSWCFYFVHAQKTILGQKPSLWWQKLPFLEVPRMTRVKFWLFEMAVPILQCFCGKKLFLRHVARNSPWTHTDRKSLQHSCARSENGWRQRGTEARDLHVSHCAGKSSFLFKTALSFDKKRSSLFTWQIDLETGGRTAC